MAKSQAKNAELVVHDHSQALVVPSFIDLNDRTGTEDITAADLRLPRLVIAQGLSPQITPDSSDYIPDLKLFDLFNDLTGDVYGRGPLKFIPIKRDVRHIEFAPRDEGGGVRDMDVPPGDPRLQWTSNEEGERIPPAATTFIEFVVLLLLEGEQPEPIVLSIKDTNKWNRKAAQRLTGFIKLPYRGVNVPIFAKVYSVASKSEKNDQGTFGVYVINQVGLVEAKELYSRAKAFRQSIEGKTIVIKREPGDDDIDATGAHTEM